MDQEKEVEAHFKASTLTIYPLDGGDEVQEYIQHEQVKVTTTRRKTWTQHNTMKFHVINGK